MKKPLAHLLRPESLDDIVGQDHLIGENQIISKMIKNKQFLSMILYGQPGVGKTTLAMVIAKALEIPFRMFNAAIDSKKDLQIIFEEAKLSKDLIVIVEEIHRLNKDKQDLLLPYLEDGTIYIIGTTTANPYHAINMAIRSRVALFEVKPLDKKQIFLSLQKIVKKDIFNDYTFTDDSLEVIAKLSNGDFRYAINILELATIYDNNIDKDAILKLVKSSNLAYEKDEDGFYDLLSAFQKSIRGSDVDAAIYYLSQLILTNNLEVIIRRLLATAYEDIGLANPAAVSRTYEACQSALILGFPEAKLPLSVAIVDLALSPKSNSAENAINKALQYTKYNPHQIPEYLKLTPVNLADKYKYPYDKPHIWPQIQYLPNAIKNFNFYEGINSSQYEQILINNNKKLKQIKKYNDLSKLK